MARPPVLVLIALLCLLTGGCTDYPRDSDEMTRRATERGMRVGASHDPPWVVVDASGNVSGPEAALMLRFARAHGYRLAWVDGGHESLMRQLEHAQLHAVIGGHHRESPWQPRVGWSQPLQLRAADTGPMPERRIALPPGQSAWHLAIDRWLAGPDAAP